MPTGARLVLRWSYHPAGHAHGPGLGLVVLVCCIAQRKLLYVEGCMQPSNIFYWVLLLGQVHEGIRGFMCSGKKVSAYDTGQRSACAWIAFNKRGILSIDMLALLIRAPVAFYNLCNVRSVHWQHVTSNSDAGPHARAEHQQGMPLPRFVLYQYSFTRVLIHSHTAQC